MHCIPSTEVLWNCWCSLHALGTRLSLRRVLEQPDWLMIVDSWYADSWPQINIHVQYLHTYIHPPPHPPIQKIRTASTGTYAPNPYPTLFYLLWGFFSWFVTSRTTYPRYSHQWKNPMGCCQCSRCSRHKLYHVFEALKSKGLICTRYSTTLAHLGLKGVMSNQQAEIYMYAPKSIFID